MQLFARMLKVDEAQRTVSGVIANEAKDRSGEVFDYVTSKPYFEEWSGNIAKATDGKSVGNVRAMHGNVAAGKLTEMMLDDAGKSITVTAKIVDDGEWKKITEGVYTGFSIGGSYVKKWDADEGKRYTAKPAEVSLVDLPCNPDAEFTVVKADGTEELRKFETVAKNDDDKAEGLTKGMCHVAQLAMTLKDIGFLTDDQYAEMVREGDDSKVPDALREWLDQGTKILNSMVVEESAEIVDGVQPQDDVEMPVLLAAQADGLEKMGAKHSKATKDMHKSIADHAQAILDHTAMLAGSDDKDDNVEAEKLAKAADDLSKITADLQKITTERDDALAKATTLQTEIDELKTKAAAPKGVVSTLGKGMDIPDATAAPDSEPVKRMDGSIDHVATATKLAKLAYQNPIRYAR